MTDYTDPEAPRTTDDRIVIANCRFARGLMTESVYRASLYAAGMRGDAIETEVRLNGPIRSRGKITTPVVGRFVSGLEQ